MNLIFEEANEIGTSLELIAKDTQQLHKPNINSVNTINTNARYNKEENVSTPETCNPSENRSRDHVIDVV